MIYRASSVDRQRCRRRLVRLASLLCGCIAVEPVFSLGTLDRVRESGTLTMGYLADARPFSYTDASGKPAGYAVTLCGKIGDAVRSELKLPRMSVNVVAVPWDERFRAVEQGAIDILCGAEPSLERRGMVDFSIPILLNGTGVVIRSDAPERLKQLLSGQETKARPIWRGSPDQAPERRAVAVIGGTTLEQAMTDHLRASRMIVDVIPVKDNSAGMQMVLARRVDAFFSDHTLLLDAVKRNPSGNRLVVLDRIFKRVQVALATPRNDAQFRLLIDRTLSRLMRSGEMTAIYTVNFGAPDRSTLDMFQLVALPD